MKYRIYALIDPRINTIRYVGITSGTLEFRLNWHYTACDDKTHYMNKGILPNNPVAKWMRALKKHNLKPTIILLEDTNNPKREKYWIQTISNKGNNLFNVTWNPHRKSKVRRNVRGRKVKHK
jgi:hypothetical protein